MSRRKTPAIKADIVLFIFSPSFPYSPALGSEKRDTKKTECRTIVLIKQIAIKSILSSPRVMVTVFMAGGFPIFDHGTGHPPSCPTVSFTTGAYRHGRNGVII
jgi:hypothetical protein